MEYGNHHHHRHAVPRVEDDCSERSRPIRWSPKEEQVEILESIYNSGVINPPKDETTRITTLLQYYGPVVDANVFYWFQNRRSRSRRRHRQIMAAAAAANIINSREDEDQEQILIGQDQQPPPPAGSPNYYYTTTGQQLSHPTPNNSGEQNLLSPSITFLHDDSAAAYSSSSSTPAINENICCSYPAQVCNLDIQRNSDQVSPDVAYTTCPGAGYALNVHYDQSAAGFISVYINGAATVVPMGPLDMKRMFGEQDFILIHSTSGMLVSNTSISSSLAHGESYFLVPAST